MFSSFDLIERDLKIVLEEEQAHVVIAGLEEDLRQAFRLREELVNMKKVAYHVHRSGTLIERSLAQLATFFRSDHEDEKSNESKQEMVMQSSQLEEVTTLSNDSTEAACSTSSGYYIHSDRFTRIVDTRMQCKGACHAAADARAIAKQICCLPRHPDKSRTKYLENFPHSLETVALLNSAMQELERYDNIPSSLKLNNLPTTGLDSCNWKHRIEVNIANLEKEETLTQDTIDFIKLLLICRGADKAVRMVDELYAAKKGIRAVVNDVKRLLPELIRRENTLSECETQLRKKLKVSDASVIFDECFAGGDYDVADVIRKRIHCRRHCSLLGGALPHLTELLAWLEKILLIVETGNNKVMFLASDSNDDRHTLPAALQVPKIDVDTMALFSYYRKVESEYRPQMFHAIRTRGWPESLQHALASSDGKEENVANNKYCRVCERTYSCLWVHRSVCCECEDRIRQTQKRCPFRDKCKSNWFCRHSLRCLICDAHSCDQCRLVRGDSSVVTALAREVNPRRIAIDFDRTLASTKGGAVPVIGKHEADVDLISLMWKYPCVVVTRNQNKAAIEQFLVNQGAPPDLEVFIVGKKESKAMHILGLKTLNYGPNSTSQQNKIHDETTGNNCVDVIFVDDSVQELVDPLVACENSVFRVLFVRSLA